MVFVVAFSGLSSVGVVKETSDRPIILVDCYEFTTPFEHQRKTVCWLTVSETYGVINYGSGWRKDVVNQCLEFGRNRGGRRGMTFSRLERTVASSGPFSAKGLILTCCLRGPHSGA